MVQMSKLTQLREAWEAKGNPPCDHPKVDKEYHLGMQTGDKACLVCGESWWPGPPPTSRGDE
jgi:hypothetical protein